MSRGTWSRGNIDSRARPRRFFSAFRCPTGGVFQQPVKEFIRRVNAGQIERGSVLVVEAFDRMSRQTPLQAFRQFSDLLEAGIEVVTLIDQRRYTEKSVNSNISDIYTSIGMMIGAHVESKNKADRIREGWVKRRTKNTNNHPSWIIRTEKGFAIDKIKQKLLNRIFTDVQTYGLERLAKTLNEERIPTLSDRKRKRDLHVWNKATLHKLIINKQVLGYQEVCRYEGRKRIRTGEWQKLYPPAIAEDLWHQANAAIKSRNRGVQMGRNVERYSNLFGRLAKCECGSQMRSRVRYYKGKRYQYLVCSAAASGACEYIKGVRVDQLEDHLFSLIRGLAYAPVKPDEAENDLSERLATAKADAKRLEGRYQRMFDLLADADDPLAVRNLSRLKDEHRSKMALVEQLQQKLATTKAAKPAAEFEELRRWANSLNGLTGADLIAARGRVAAALPSVLAGLAFTGSNIKLSFANGWTINPNEWKSLGLNAIVGPNRSWGTIAGIQMPDEVRRQARKQSSKVLAEFRLEQKAWKAKNSGS